MKFSIKNFFSKCDQIRRKLPIWSHLLKKSLMENLIFFALEDLSVKHKHFALKKKRAWKSSQENVILLKIFDRKKLPSSFKTHYRLYNYCKS